MNNKLTTPQQYLDSVKSDLQTHLGIKDTKLLNSGPLSALANLIANIGFDAKKYYEYIIKEFNVATASQLKSMLFHASVYSYDFNLALPSKADAYIKIPQTTIAADRKIKYTIPSFTNFVLNGAVFRIEGEIDIEITSDSLTATLLRDNQILNLVFTVNTDSSGNPYYYILVPSEYVIQVERVVDKFVAPKYNVGDNITYEISLPNDNQLYRMQVLVNPASNPPLNSSSLQNIPFDNIKNYYPNLVPYQLKYFKFNVDNLEKVVFASMNDFSNISFTLGNGIFGSKLNVNDEIFLIAEYCKGQGGNIPAGQSRISNIDYYEFNTVDNTTITSSSVNLYVQTITPATGGLNASNINEIRLGILKKITERNSLITQLDFEKYFSDPVTGKLATVISRQIDTMSPLVTVYSVIRDPYDYHIINTTTMNMTSDSCFDSTKNYCINPTVTIDSTYNMISPFIFIKQDKISSYFKKDNNPVSMNIVSIFSNPEITPMLNINWHSDDEYFYFEASGVNSSYYIEINTSVGTYKLDSSNNYTAKITSPNMILGRFFNDALIIDSVKIKNVNNDAAIHIYSVNEPLNIVTRIQDHAVYDFDSTGNKILFVPFIDIDFYNNMLNDSKYETCFYDFFKIAGPDIVSKLAFNIRLNQVFANTVSVDSINSDSVVLNDNSTLEALYNISLNIIYSQRRLSELNLTLFNLKTDIQLAVLDYFDKHQGNKISHYQTELIKVIKNLYPDAIQEVIVNSPKSLVTKGWVKTINEGSYTADRLLNSSPTYFYFDLNNIDLKFTVSDQG